LLALATLALLADVLLFVADLLVVWAGRRQPSNYVLAAVTVLLAVPLYFLCKKIHVWSFAAPDHESIGVCIDGDIEPLVVSVDGVTCQEIEGLPKSGKPPLRDQVFRWTVFIAWLLLGAVLTFHVVHSLHAEPMRTLNSTQVTAVRFFCVPGAYISFVVLAALMTGNRRYVVLRLRTAVTAQAVLALLIAVFVHGWLQELRVTEIVLAVCAGACGLGMLLDVTCVGDARSHVGNTAPLVREIWKRLPYLNRLSAWADACLPPLLPDRVQKRIAASCLKVRERPYLAARDIGRRLGQVKVDYVVCVATVLRCLTVQRSVSVADAGKATELECRTPKVDMWDLVLFPLNVPDSFRTHEESTALGEAWDVVDMCRACGGSGQVSEIYYENKYYFVQDQYGNNMGRSENIQKQRWVTCGACGGCMRMRRQQVLHTRWRPFFPMAACPDVPEPRRICEAADATLAHASLMEGFETAAAPVSVHVRNQDTTLVRDLQNSLHGLLDWHKKERDLVERAHGGKLYRAEFRLLAFRILRVRACRGGLTGWFFGKLPEFHLPRLPLSVSALSTVVFMPPLAIALGAAIIWALYGLLSPILQPPPSFWDQAGRVNGARQDSSAEETPGSRGGPVVP
jgi:hypothetical protein